MTDQIGHAYVGTSGWKKPHWRGGFYPKGLVQRRELEFASRRFTSLEVNSTFHGLQRATSFTTWRDETPAGFVFAVKGLEAVTRVPGSPNARRNLSEFFASGVLQLGEKLGPMLWQLPSEPPFDAARTGRFLEQLPRTFGEARALAAEADPAFTKAKASASQNDNASENAHDDRPLRHAIEARNASYLNTAFTDLLSAAGVAVVFTNAPDAPGFRAVTADFVYVRLSSGDDHFADGYDDATLREWADRILAWTTGAPPRDVFAYFKNPAGVLPHTPHNAVRLLRMLGQDPQASAFELGGTNF